MNREEKKRITEENIIDAAYQLFSSKGYDLTTVADITELAGVAKGTFFNYFRTKDEVLVRIQKSLFFSEITQISEQADSPFTPKVLSLVKELGDSFNGNRTLVRVSLQQLLSGGSAGTIQGSMQAKVDALTVIFKKAQQAGELTGDIPAEEMSQTALKLYKGTLMDWCTSRVEANLGDQLMEAFRIFTRGIQR
ncbi:TetR/AcrR family transcriptional regulator [Paenibacillus sp. 1011MAR3C5]|uniref:TetR/AcrR family transcriptional regulator n=1 Tax=Paenibacillus sp. 1011MAR3C5 TaxID=1675787 RepID=UPI001603558C|nr:TetR/AcrR family transcriptional regulator [Paenibacillus sp. 1011MAR3C5]